MSTDTLTPETTAVMASTLATSGLATPDETPDTRAKREHSERCAAGRARKLIQDSRKVRAHVRDARRIAVGSLKGPERKEAASRFSSERREEISLSLDGLKVTLFLAHKRRLASGAARLTAHGTVRVSDGDGEVTVLLKGEVTSLDTTRSADGAAVTVTLHRRVSEDLEGKKTYRYRVADACEGRDEAGSPARYQVQGTLACSEFVRVAVETAILD